MNTSEQILKQVDKCHDNNPWPFDYDVGKNPTKEEEEEAKIDQYFDTYYRNLKKTGIVEYLDEFILDLEQDVAKLLFDPEIKSITIVRDPVFDDVIYLKAERKNGKKLH